MFKENKDFFLYIIGIIALFVVTVFILNTYLVPQSTSTSNENEKNESSETDSCGFLGLGCFFQNLISGNGASSKQYTEYPQMSIDTTKDYKAVVKTNKGSFTIDLYEKNAPKAVNNFIFLAKEDYYDYVQFHRVIKSLLIQTGDRKTLDKDPSNDGQGGPGYTFEDEVNWKSLDFSNAKKQQLKNLGYESNSLVKSKHLEYKTVAMANGGPNTNGSQFFIVTAMSNNPLVKGLDGRHTVFGKVVSGWNTVEEISNVEVDDPSSSSPHPVSEVYIINISIISN